MDSNLTVADAKAAFARFGYSDAELFRRLNRGSEHLLNSDVFADIFSILEVTSTTGYVTIPRSFGRAYGAIQDNCVQPILSQWTPFVGLGLARLNPAELTFGGVRDLGNHFCTQSEVWASGVQQPGTLRVIISNSADAGKAIRFSGTDTDGNRIFDAVGNEGFSIATFNPSADTDKTFVTVDGIQADAGFIGRWTLWKVISGTATQIGSYEPSETRPKYTRYQVNPSQGTIFLICRRKCVPYIALTDWIYPDNLDVFELTSMALTYRDRGDFKAEEEAYKTSKRYLKEVYASTVPYVEMHLTSDGFGASLRNFKRDGRWGIQTGLVTTFGG